MACFDRRRDAATSHAFIPSDADRDAVDSENEPLSTNHSHADCGPTTSASASAVGREHNSDKTRTSEPRASASKRRGDWSMQEDDRLRKAIRQHGPGRLGDLSDRIAPEFGERTYDAVRHRIRKLTREEAGSAVPQPEPAFQAFDSESDGDDVDSDGIEPSEQSDPFSRPGLTSPDGSAGEPPSHGDRDLQGRHGRLSWSKEEDDYLRQAVRRHGWCKITDIAAEFQNKTHGGMQMNRPFGGVRNRMHRLGLRIRANSSVKPEPEELCEDREVESDEEELGAQLERGDGTRARWKTKGSRYLHRSVRLCRGGQQLDGVVVGWRPANRDTSRSIDPETGP